MSDTGNVIALPTAPVENLEGDPPISTRTRTSRTRRVKTGPVLRKERIRQILDARDSLSTALEVMRIICSGFDTDGSMHSTANALDMHAGLGQAFGHIKNASNLLFESRYGEEDVEVSGEFMDVLWDSADIVICVKTVLQHKKLPHGHGMTVCPVSGALTVAIGMFEGLVSDISAFVANVRIMSASPTGRRVVPYRAAAVAEVAHG